MRRLVPVMLLTGVLGLRASTALGADWYVEQAALAGGDGSQAKPFKTIGAAKAVLKSGDTIWLRNGTYQETVNFWHAPAGSGGPTTVRAVAGHQPVVDGGGTGDFILQAGETHNMTFQGLTLRNGATAFHFYKANGGKVIDCKTENTGTAVAFYFASAGTVTGSDLYGSVSGKQSDGTIVARNKIHNSKAEGIALHADSKNCKYLNNVVYDNTSVNIYLDSSSYMTVDGNLIYTTGTPASELAGIQLADESYANVTSPKLGNITITNNVIINQWHGICFWQGHFPGQSALKNVTIANNTIVNSRANAIVWDAGPHAGSVVRNNLFTIASGGSYLLLAKSTSGIAVDHNLWYAPGIAKPFNWGGGSASDHGAWASASGQGAGDVIAEPKLVGTWGLPVQNLKLAEGSPAINKGVAIAGLAHDFEGKLRPAGAAFDLGAFEHGAVGGHDGSMPKLDLGGSGPGLEAGGPAPDSGSGGELGSEDGGGRLRLTSSCSFGRGPAPANAVLLLLGVALLVLLGRRWLLPG